MFCPYVRKTYTKITGIHYNEDEIEDRSIIHEEFSNMECKKAECGAWNDGRCRYNEQSK